jgi:hypothetical protein
MSPLPPLASSLILIFLFDLLKIIIEGSITAKVFIINSYNLTLYGTISASGTGHPAALGPGAGISNNTYGGGGSYGGNSKAKFTIE